MRISASLSTLIIALCMSASIFFAYPGLVARAQTSIEDAVAAREAQLRAELDAVLKEIEVQKGILTTKQAEGTSLQRDLAILTAQINQAKLKIRAKNIAIESLGKDIKSKESNIKTLQESVDQGKASLAQLIRKSNQVRGSSLAEIAMSGKSMSDYLQDADAYWVIKRDLNVTLDEIREHKTKTEKERDDLDKKRLSEIDEKVSIEAETRIIQKAEAEKNRLLNLSKAEQKNYQTQIANKEKRAGQIRNALFSLRDASAIPFGTALQYANEASKVTGVRPAFILAILTQESEMGKNIGRCNRAGDPPSKSWREIMKPERDHAPYLEITKALGFDPDTMPLSCPIGNGWGGAMGPSQFIPSTWKAYANRIAKATGSSSSNPWDARHAIFATAIYVSDLGAGAQTFSAEKTAALRYYAGSNWNKPANQFYGNQVMAKATNIQENMIDVLNGL